MKIKLNSKQDVNDFIDVCCKFKFDVDACYGHYIIDAKSWLGIMSFGLGKELTIILHTEDINKINKFNVLTERWRIND